VTEQDIRSIKQGCDRRHQFSDEAGAVDEWRFAETIGSTRQLQGADIELRQARRPKAERRGAATGMVEAEQAKRRVVSR